MTTDRAWAIRPKWYRFESARSYALRQCRAAGVPIDVVERGLTSRKQPNYKRVWSDPDTPAVIEAAAGRAEGHAGRLLRLAQPVPDTYPARFLCRLCAADEIIEQIPHDRENWCLRHSGQMVWVGPGTSPDSQIVMRFDQAQARAERRFRKMSAAGRIDVRLHSRAWEMVRDSARLSGASAGINDSTDDEIQARALLFPQLVSILETLTSPVAADRWRVCATSRLREEIAASLAHITDDASVLTERIVLWLRPFRRQLVTTGLEPLDIPLDIIDAESIIDVNAYYPSWIRRHPRAIAEWDWKRNDPNHDPWSNAALSRKAWWVCDKGHSWQTTPHVRGAAQTGCPFCSGMEVWPGQSDLRTLFPEIAAEWDATPGVNAGSPDTVNATSGRKITWRCPDGHTWPMAISQRTKYGSGCKVCANHAVHVGHNDLATTHPSLIAEWSSDNGRLPHEFVAGSDHRATWLCPEHHTWTTTIYSRAAQGTGCPACAGRVVVAGFNDLATVNPKLAFEWDRAPGKNDRAPTEVTFRSSYLAGWICNDDHTWMASVANRQAGSTCPFCSGRRAISGKTDLATLRPDLAAEWDPDNDRRADQVTLSSHYYAAWRCRVRDNHRWPASVKNRSSGTGCPYCAGKRPVQGENDLATLRPDLAAEWDASNSILPTEVTIGSGRRIIWRCSKDGYIWEAVVQKRTDVSGGVCSECKTRGAHRRASELAATKIGLRARE